MSDYYSEHSVLNHRPSPRVGNRVEYLTFEGDGGDLETWTPMGKVMGFGTSNGEPVVLVYLDEPFYGEGRKVYVTVLSVHLDSIRVQQ